MREQDGCPAILIRTGRAEIVQFHEVFRCARVEWNKRGHPFTECDDLCLLTDR